MLDLLRKKAQSPLIQGTILVIALVFIFWGAGSTYRGSRNGVATVNDEVISYEAYQKAYEQLANQYRNQFGGNLPKGLLETLDLEGQTLEQLNGSVGQRYGVDSVYRLSKQQASQLIDEFGGKSKNPRRAA